MFALTYAFRNLRRNWLRSSVTLFGVAALLLLVGMLMAIVSGFAVARKPDSQARRLIVRHEVSLTINLPEAYWERIRGVPHVVEAAPTNWFGGTYKDPKNFFARFFVDPDTFLNVYGPPDIELPADMAAAWKADRQGCIASKKIADEFGWKLGDRIVIEGDIYPVNVELTLDGIFTGKADALYFNRRYVEEALGNPGSVGTFDVLIDDPANLPGTAAAIDAMFANSDSPVKAETEAAFMAGFVSMAGNVEGLLKRLSLIIAATVLLTAGNTMAMAVRERTAEIAILKVIGFQPGCIVRLILTESMLLSGVAGLLGIGTFWLATWYFLVVRGVTIPMLWFPPTLPTPMGISLLLGSVLLGAVAGMAPAWLAAHRNVVDSLRRN